VPVFFCYKEIYLSSCEMPKLAKMREAAFGRAVLAFLCGASIGETAALTYTHGVRLPPWRNAPAPACAAAEDDVCSIDRRCVYFVTGNEKKKREVNAIVSYHELPFSVEHVDLDLPELQGDPEDICRAKVAAAAEHVGGGSVLVEDTSLCFNALNGLPGVYVKWFVDAIGNDGLHRLLDGYEDKTAYARCILGFKKGALQSVPTRAPLPLPPISAARPFPH
jgi:hypothetical protein